MKVVTAEQIKRLDERTIKECGIPGIVLMENASQGTVRHLLQHFPDALKKKVAVVAGKGNNAGDGFGVARILMNKGCCVTIYLLAEPEEIKGDAKINLDIVFSMKARIYPAPDEKAFESIKAALREADLIVDAMLGTGLKGEVTGYYAEVIAFLNQLKKPIISVDIPSGLDTNEGKPLGTCIKADLTVTFGLPKVGQLIYPGVDYVGKLALVDISIPSYLVDEENIDTEILELEELRKALIPRRGDSHKGDFGHILVIAGSTGKTGAASMTSEASLRSGAGLVTLAIPESLNQILEMKLTEVMTEPIPDEGRGFFGKAGLEKLLSLCQGKDLILLGPGIGTHPETVEVVKEIVTSFPKPLVIDANGLNCISKDVDILTGAKAPLILTPHPGEIARLRKISTKEVQERRIDMAREFAKEYGLYLVLKGARTLISSPHGHVFINPTGNPGMATAGMGDVLTGMIGGFVAQNMPIIDALKLAVFLHGYCGDKAKEQWGERALIATDVMAKIPEILKDLEEYDYTDYKRITQITMVD